MIRRCDACYWFLARSIGCSHRDGQHLCQAVDPSKGCRYFRPASLSDWRCGTCVYLGSDARSCMERGGPTTTDSRCSKWEMHPKEEAQNVK